MQKLTMSLKSLLCEIRQHDKGYPRYWKPKSREKLEAMGLVEKRPGEYGPENYFLTEAGEKAYQELP